VRIFKTKWFVRFARRERISDASLKGVIERAERGMIDVDLGGGLIKQRVARPGQGRSGGFRMIVAYRTEDKAFFLYSFAKNDLDTIEDDELQTLRDLASDMLTRNDTILERAKEEGELQEIDDGEKTE